MIDRMSHSWSTAGIWLGAAAWGTSTELNYALASNLCGSRAILVVLVAVGLALISLAGGAVSLRAFRHRSVRLATATPEAGTPYEMLAMIGIGASVLFALIIVMQGVAPLFLPGCKP